MANTQQDIQNYRAKAEAGDASAMNSLGCAYHNADGVERDYARAMQWYKQAAEKGEPYAMCNIAVLYRYGKGVEKDLETAFRWYLKAAKLGHAAAEESIGIFYDFGYGVERDYQKAAEWYQKAAYKNRGLAQNNLGACYEQGNGIAKDYEQAFYWYQRGAQNGNEWAQCNLGILYSEGKGCEKNLRLAKRWLEKSAKKGHERAKEKLKVVLDNYDENMDKWIFTCQLFTNNPYRILGVYSNVTEREKKSAYSRLTAFAKVGKSFSTPLDKFTDCFITPIYPREIDLFGEVPCSENEIYQREKTPTELYAAIREATKKMAEIKASSSYQSAIRKKDKVDDDGNSDLFRTGDLTASERSSLDNYRRTNDLKTDLQYAYDFSRVKASHPIRSSETISYAKNILEDPTNKIKYSFFWFCKETETDAIALQHFAEGRRDVAVDLWNQKEGDVSALINLAVLAFLEEDDFGFVDTVTKVIHTETLRKQFLRYVSPESISMDESELARILMDALFTEVPETYWLTPFRMRGTSADDDEYLENKYSKHHLDILNAEINALYEYESPSSQEWYERLLKACFIADRELGSLNDVCNYTNYKYDFISDKIALAILSASQAFHRKCFKLDYDVSAHCENIAKRAKDIASGESAIHEIEEAFSELQKIIVELPTRNVFVARNQVYDLLDAAAKKKEDVRNALTLVLECAPLIVALKEELGHTSELYLKISTDIAATALNMTIGHFNAMWKDFDELVKREKSSFPSAAYVYRLPNVKKEVDKVKSVLKDCCQLFANIDQMDLIDEFKEGRYQRNKTAIIKNASESDVDTIYRPTIDLRTEKQVFAHCSTIADYMAYLKRYGEKAKYIDETRKKIAEFEKADDDFWSLCLSSLKYSDYLEKYPNGRHAESARQYKMQLEAAERAKAEQEEKDFWDACVSNKAYRAYVTKFPNGKYSIIARENILKSSKRAHKIFLFGFLVCSVIAILCLLFRRDGLMIESSKITLLSIGGVFFVSTCWLSYIAWNKEDGHFKHLNITENLNSVGSAAFLSLFIAGIVGGAISSLTCWLTPSVIVVGEGQSHEKFHLIGQMNGNFLDSKSLYLQNTTDKTLFLVGVYYSSSFSYSSKEDIIKTIPPRGAITIDDVPYEYFEIPPRTISYRTRRYSSTSGMRKWLLLDTQMFNEYNQ